MSLKKTTLQDLADRAKVHKSTVVRALKNNPTIGEATRKRIQRLAEQLDYRPNPLAVRLMQDVKRGGALSSGDVIAVWNPESDRVMEGTYWPESVEIFQGARKQAERMGYRYEEICYSQKGMTSKRAESMLRNRGIQGLLLMIPRLSEEPLQLNLSYFSPVSVSHEPYIGTVHRVIHNAQAALEVVMQKMVADDVRSVAFMLPVCIQKMTTLYCAFMGAWQHFSQNRGHESMPVFFYEPVDEKGVWANIGDLSQWLEKHQPEVIIGQNEMIPEILERCLEIRVPDEIGYVSIAIHGENESNRFAGIRAPNEEIGRYAIKRIVSMLQTGERGIPQFPETTLLPGVWQDGGSYFRKG